MAILLAATPGCGAIVPGILCSQVGYERDGSKRAIIRAEDSDFLDDGTFFWIEDSAGETAYEGEIEKWGERWNSSWWIVDFSPLAKTGDYRIFLKKDYRTLVTGDNIRVEENILWKQCLHKVAIEQLIVRAEEARIGIGFRDCGSDIQELSSHVVLLVGLCDLLEFASERLSDEEEAGILSHLLRGADFIAYLQDLAREQGIGDGAVVHEPRRLYAVTGDVAKAAMVLARASRLVEKTAPDMRAEYLARSAMAFEWIEKHGPVMNAEELDFFSFTHGAPLEYVPPRQWMTRDLVMMMWASVELCKAGKGEYKEKAAAYAERIMRRQVPESKKEGPFYGHFYTFDDRRFTEKANIHCGWGDREGRKVNQGGHFPHYLIPFLEACKIWPDHPGAKQWQNCLRDFAYGYFLPACSESPFFILPAGYYQGEGLLFFSGWYHGHNGIYGHAAALALEFERFFNDTRFREVAAGNLQWIAGLNSGIKEEGRYIPFSMIHGVGNRFKGGWVNIPGTICNGFDADRQFKITMPRAATDGPNFFTDEGYIVHAGSFLSGLARWSW